MKRKKVSIIVPIYNVEKYLPNCIESLISQSYKNIEIILVNDGSLDKCLDICNDFSKNDNRIIVINKKNGGVSSARNIGFDKSSGDYIVYVDGDDWLEVDYVEYMVSLLENNKCDFALSLNCFMNSNEKQIKKDNQKKLTSVESTALLLSSRVEVGCWNKIYKRDFLQKNNIKFNEKQFFGEGLCYIIDVAQKSKFTAVGERKVYNYRQDNLTSATKKYNHVKFINGLKSLDIINSTLLYDDKNVIEQLNIHYCLFLSNALYNTVFYNKKKEYISDFKKWSVVAKRYYKKILRCKKINLKKKISLFINIYFTKLFVFIRKIQSMFRGKNE